jgi:glycosyltransferase involved in cell wall biosynthesis
MERVSIDLVICTYNRASLLDRILEAISRQRIPDYVVWSVLVVDNNCTDNTYQVVEKHRKIGRIPLGAVHEPRQGLTPARVCGYKNTTGDWIAYVDDDCLLAENWVEQAAAFALEYSDCGGFGGEVTLHWERQPQSYVMDFTWAFAQQCHGGKVRRVQCLVGAGMVLRRAALESSGWTDRQLLGDRVGEKLDSGGDVELALRVGAQGPLFYNPNCKLKHLIPADRISFDYLKRICYSLGTSKVLGDSMLQTSSYLAWLVRSSAWAFRYLANTLAHTVSVLLGRKSAKAIAIMLRFFLGYCAGIYLLVRMPAAKREKLLGCAAVQNEAGCRNTGDNNGLGGWD